MNELKIKQIIPAPDNLYVVYKDDGSIFDSKVICLALWSVSEITMMEHGEDGAIEVVADNIVSIFYK